MLSKIVNVVNLKNIQILIHKLKKYAKKNQRDIALISGVILISLLSFAAGYITAKNEKTEPLIIEQINNNNLPE